MSYVPKSAQRKIDAANRAIAKLPHRVAEATDPKPHVPFVPKQLVAGQGGAQMWDVYLDDVKQHLCKEADVARGFIVRYTQGVGNKPTTQQVEKIYGKVRIEKKAN